MTQFLITYDTQTRGIVSLESSPAPYNLNDYVEHPQAPAFAYALFTFHLTGSQLIHKIGCDGEVVIGDRGGVTGIRFKDLALLFNQKSKDAELQRVAERYQTFRELEMHKAFTAIEAHPSVRENINVLQKAVNRLAHPVTYVLPEYISANKDTVFA